MCFPPFTTTAAQNAGAAAAKMPVNTTAPTQAIPDYFQQRDELMKELQRGPRGNSTVRG
jgi:hypothetical protein